MSRELTDATRGVLREAGRLGGLTGRKNTRPGYLARLLALGAAFDAEDNLVEYDPATIRAKAALTAKARLGLAQARKAKADKKAGK